MSDSTSFFEEAHSGKPTGLKSWLFTTDHKRIGVLYLCSIMVWFIIAVFIGLLIRTELMKTGETLFSPDTYNAMFTLHGVIMIFLFIIPGIPAIFGNFLLPIQIGADDVFFPRLNLFSWYLYIIGGFVALISLFVGGLPDTGWTFYVPFSVSTNTNVTATVFAAFILGFSSMLTGMNFITTIHRKRMKGMKWMHIPLFTWSLYATAWVQLLATPIRLWSVVMKR